MNGRNNNKTDVRSFHLDCCSTQRIIMNFVAVLGKKSLLDAKARTIKPVPQLAYVFTLSL